MACQQLNWSRNVNKRLQCIRLYFSIVLVFRLCELCKKILQICTGDFFSSLWVTICSKQNVLDKFEVLEVKF